MNTSQEMITPIIEKGFEDCHNLYDLHMENRPIIFMKDRVNEGKKSRQSYFFTLVLNLCYISAIFYRFHGEINKVKEFY